MPSEHECVRVCIKIALAMDAIDRDPTLKDVSKRSIWLSLAHLHDETHRLCEKLKLRSQDPEHP